MDEKWRPVVGFEELYEVSDLGRVRSLRRQVPGVSRSGSMFMRWRGGNIMKAHAGRGGYLRLSLRRVDECNLVFVHALVCEAFNGARPAGHQVNHIDCDRTNNRASNLEWVTPLGNAAHRETHGHSLRGQGNGRATVSDEVVQEIRKRYTGKYGSVSTLAQEFDLSAGVVYHIVKQRTWRHI